MPYETLILQGFELICKEINFEWKCMGLKKLIGSQKNLRTYKSYFYEMLY